MQIANSSRLPRRGLTADHERVREVGPVAVNDDREVEQEQVARLDHPVARRTAPIDLAPRTGDEIAVHLNLFAQLSTGCGLNQQEGVELRHAWLDLRHCGRVRRFAGPDGLLDQCQLVRDPWLCGACGSAGRGCTAGSRVHETKLSDSDTKPLERTPSRTARRCPAPAGRAAAGRISSRCTSPGKQPRPRNFDRETVAAGCRRSGSSDRARARAPRPTSTVLKTNGDGAKVCQVDQAFRRGDEQGVARLWKGLPEPIAPGLYSRSA